MGRLSTGFPGGRRGFLRAAGAALAGLTAGCGKEATPKPPPAPPATPPVPTPPAPPAWNLSDLAPEPDWSRLEVFQETITRGDFEFLLRDVLTDGNASWTTVELRDDRALIRTSTARAEAPRFELRFAAKSSTPAPPRYWRDPSELPPPSSADRPLEGLHIALDAGHIGGVWAQMEERWYKSGDAPPVKEGDMTLRVAVLLKTILEGKGARASLVRPEPAPLTARRPENLLKEAAASLARSGRTATDQALRQESERLFYRTAEIRERGKKVNETLKPDMVVCLHFNAEGWGSDTGKPVFSPRNHLHVLAHGCLSQAEFGLDDQRLDALLRLLQRAPDTEIPLADGVARAMAAATGLPPYTYLGPSARRVNENPYLWARNLLANRVYECPVIFPEPWVMNNQEFFERFLAGDYEGEALVGGVMRRSLFREYAESVADGLASVCAAMRAGV